MLIFAICAVVIFLFSYFLLVISASQSIRKRIGEIVDDGYQQLEEAVDTITQEMVSTQENIDQKLNEVERLKIELQSILNSLDVPHSVSKSALEAHSKNELIKENNDSFDLNFSKPKFSEIKSSMQHVNDEQHSTPIDLGDDSTNSKHSLLVGFKKDDYATI